MKKQDDIEFEVMADDLEFPEGPVALQDGSVLVVEIAGQRLTHVSRTGKKNVVAVTGGGPNGAAIGPDGACYICNNGGFSWTKENGRIRRTGTAADYKGGRIERVDLSSGKVEVLYTHCQNERLKGPNDIVFDETGGFYFTDLGKTWERSLEIGSVYYAKPDGSSIREVIFPLIKPNGIGLSPDGKILYVAETESGRLWRYPVISPGQIELLPYPAVNGGAFVGGLPDDSRLDSLAVQADGKIAVATLMNGGITIFSPTDRSCERIPMPDRHTTNICFGGSDLKTAYITLSSTKRLIKMRWQSAGLRLHFPRVE